jgi:hypothetical protein
MSFSLIRTFLHETMKPDDVQNKRKINNNLFDVETTFWQSLNKDIFSQQLQNDGKHCFNATNKVQTKTKRNSNQKTKKPSLERGYHYVEDEKRFSRIRKQLIFGKNNNNKSISSHS